MLTQAPLTAKSLARGMLNLNTEIKIVENIRAVITAGYKTAGFI